MPEDRRFTLQPAVLRRQRRILYVALAVYLALLLGLLALVVAGVRAGSPVAVPLAALSAAVAGFFAVVVVARLRATRRLLRRGGDLVVTAEGVRDGAELLAWDGIGAVRVYRDHLPRIVLGRRYYRATTYGVPLDELVAAFARHREVTDPDAPRLPVYDEPARAWTFFFDDWQLRGLRRGYRRSALTVAGGLAPALAALLVLRSWPVAALLLAGVIGVLVWIGRRLRKVNQGLRLNRGGRGRLILTPEHLVWIGTHTPIGWSHIQHLSVVRTERPALAGVIRCPGDHGTCRFRGRTIALKVPAPMYATTIEQLVGAFTRYTTVDS